MNCFKNKKKNFISFNFFVNIISKRYISQLVNRKFALPYIFKSEYMHDFMKMFQFKCDDVLK